MIKKILLSILVGILSLSGGCSYLPWFESESEPEVVEPISESPPVADEEIDVALEPPSSSTEVAGLIAPTDPSQQRSAIAQGRPDPFNPLSVPPVVTVNPAEPGSTSSGAPSASPSSPARSSLPAPPASSPARSPSSSSPARSPVAPPASSPARSPATSPASSPARSSPSSSPARSPATSPASSPARSSPSSSPARSPATSPASSPARSLPPVAVKPAPPSPGATNAPSPSEQPSTPPQPVAAIAQDVVVTGVIQVGNTTQIILKAPNEAHSRYVQPGQYLANQQVLVKRVERQNEMPVVVLEQNGIEVFKSVGEKAQEVSYDKSESSIALVSSSEVG